MKKKFFGVLFVNRLEITLPDGMQFEETEAGIYKFTINMVEKDNMLMDGMIKSQYYGQKGIGRLDNEILNASFYKKFDVISEQEEIMIRLATVNDAEQLEILNNEFNGKGETTLEKIKYSLLNNQQEVIIVADDNGLLVGFVCIQLKKSFCYEDYMPEITEVYVKMQYRKRGIASAMVTFAEDYCSKIYPLHKYEILTGKNNYNAQSVYNKLGYKNDGEIHLSKRTMI